MTNDILSKQLRTSLQGYGLRPEDEQIDQLMLYIELLQEWGKAHNLTRVTPEQFIERHLCNSLGISKTPVWSTNGRLIDIGSGAGFPGLVLKIVYPELEVCLLESVQKKCLFLEAVISRCKLSGIEVRNMRAEVVAHESDYREKFDVCTSRAVAPLNILVELCLPFVRPGGVMLALKGDALDQELVVMGGHAKSLGGSDPEVTRTKDGSSVISIEKTAHSPKHFPRSAAVLKRERGKP